MRAPYWLCTRPSRKAKALSTGVADHVLDPSRDDIAARVAEITGGLGADVCFECSSVNAVLDQLFDAVKPAASRDVESFQPLGEVFGVGHATFPFFAGRINRPSSPSL